MLIYTNEVHMSRVKRRAGSVPMLKKPDLSRIVRLDRPPRLRLVSAQFADGVVVNHYKATTDRQ
jgi:hypothetical protein